jgi:uncharacterized membrane protein YsdA (DUF1294 family)
MGAVAYALIYAAMMSVAAFILCGLDKRAAVRRTERVPERTLLALSALGGSVGMLLGMAVFRHKIRKLRFALGVPLMLLLQLAAIYAATRWMFRAM